MGKEKEMKNPCKELTDRMSLYEKFRRGLITFNELCNKLTRLDNEAQTS